MNTQKTDLLKHYFNQNFKSLNEYAKLKNHVTNVLISSHRFQLSHNSSHMTASEGNYSPLAADWKCVRAREEIIK